MFKLSVVVCTYNTKIEYVETCLKSIKNQTLSDIQIVFVDDGSNIDYSDILKNFYNVKYIKTDNKGTLSARLTGIKNADADFVCFADSDDFMSFCYYDSMLEKQRQTGADIVFNDWAFSTQKTKFVCISDSTIKTDFSIENDEVLKQYFSKQGKEHAYYVLWNKLFKKQLLLDATNEIEKIKIKDKFLFAEDSLISFFAFCFAKKITNVHVGFYFYRVHQNQQIMINSEEKLKNQVCCMSFVFDCFENYLKQINRFDDVKKDFLLWKNTMASSEYTVAKTGGYKNVFGLIKEKYGVKKLHKIPLKTEIVYAKHKILPENIFEIDDELKRVVICQNKKVYVEKNSYAKRQLINIKSLFVSNFEFAKTKKEASTVISKDKINLKTKVLHNYFIYVCGMILFPKGSKIRGFLKKKM